MARKRGRPRNPGRLQHDLAIWLRLSQADATQSNSSAPGKLFMGVVEKKPVEKKPEDDVSKAARALAKQWAETGYNVSWQSIRSRYMEMRTARGAAEAAAKEGTDDLH